MRAEAPFPLEANQNRSYFSRRDQGRLHWLKSKAYGVQSYGQFQLRSELDSRGFVLELKEDVGQRLDAGTGCHAGIRHLRQVFGQESCSAGADVVLQLAGRQFGSERSSGNSDARRSCVSSGPIWVT